MSRRSRQRAARRRHRHAIRLARIAQSQARMEELKAHVVELQTPRDARTTGHALQAVASGRVEPQRSLEELLAPAIVIDAAPRFEAFRPCPNGHLGYHLLAPTENPGYVERTCTWDGCGQTWRERV